MRPFPAAWVMRLNEMAKGLRRRQGWGDIFASVEAPAGPDHPPVLRLEKSGTFITEPLDPRLIEQVMRTGQEAPMLIAMRQAFLRLQKAADRRESRRPQAPGRRRF